MGATPFVDQSGFTCRVFLPAMRIVSLVPSQTELLFYLGLDAQVVGVTKFCVHPAKARTNCTVVGGTKNPDVEVIRHLKPDLIIGNKEENDQATIEALRAEFPVWLSDIFSIPDALDMIQTIGRLTGKEPQAVRLVAHIRTAFARMPFFRGQRVLYLIWRKPWMAAGTQTFIHAVIEAAGCTNVVKQPRYPEYSVDTLAQLHPEFVFLSSEPYPFGTKHMAEVAAMFPTAQVVLVNGEMFSWYGSRLLATPDYLEELYRRVIPTFATSSQKEG